MFRNDEAAVARDLEGEGIVVTPCLAQVEHGSVQLGQPLKLQEHVATGTNRFGCCRCPFGHEPAAIEHHDPVGHWSASSRYWVVRRSTPPRMHQVTDDLPHGVAGCGDQARWSAHPRR